MKQLDKRSVWLFFMNSVIGVFLLAIMFSFYAVTWSADGGDLDLFVFFKWAFVVAMALLMLAFIWAKLTYHFYRYELTELGFKKESGVIYKKYVTIPYERIQNVDIHRGILARILGLSDLHIQTAGASATMGRYGIMGVGAEGRLPGISKEDAEALRDELVQRASKNRGQGL